MCGHCIVDGFLGMVVEDPMTATLARLEPIFMPLALMHGGDIRESLMALMASPKADQVGAVVPVTLAIELFLTVGFDADLAGWVETHFAKDWRVFASGRRMLGEGTQLVGSLLSPDFWKSSDLLEGLVSQADATTGEAVMILEAYHSWWLQEVGKTAPVAPAERLRTTGIMDPIDGTTREDWQNFHAGFPVVYLAARWLAKQSGHALLETLALTFPPEVPDFTGMDLWLQRRALEWVYHHEGFGFIEEHIAKIGWHALLELALREHWGVERKAYVRGVIKRGECDVGVGLPEAFLEDCEGWVALDESANGH